MVDETADAKSFVLGIPDELRAAFLYEAGQFCTFRVTVDGQQHLRSYSMSSSPDVDDEFQVTVKRVPGGVVSNFMVDTLVVGSLVDTTCPAGVFCLSRAVGRGDVVAFCGGSGVTPIASIAKTALATTDRTVRILYANRDADSVIFDDALAKLAVAYSDRVHLVTRLDVEDGFVDAAAATQVADDSTDADYFICGPGPFMDIVETALLDSGAPAERIHIERFTPAAPASGEADGADTADGGAGQVTITLAGRTETTEHHPGATILQTARQIGMAPPYSCESGSCATCMARLTDGTVAMHVNDALTDDEVADGLILTCQSVPTSPAVSVVYEF